MAQEVKNPLAMQETQATQVQSPDKQLCHADYMGKRKSEQRKGGCESYGWM